MCAFKGSTYSLVFDCFVLKTKQLFQPTIFQIDTKIVIYLENSFYFHDLFFKHKNLYYVQLVFYHHKTYIRRMCSIELCYNNHLPHTLLLFLSQDENKFALITS